MEATTLVVVGLIQTHFDAIVFLVALHMILALGRKVGSSGLTDASVNVGFGSSFSITASLKGEASTSSPMALNFSDHDVDSGPGTPAREDGTSAEDLSS